MVLAPAPILPSCPLPAFFFFFFLVIEEELLYNIGLIFAMHQHWGFPGGASGEVLVCQCSRS